MLTVPARLSALVVVVFGFAIVTIAAQQPAGPQVAGLKVVVIAGEDAVNIIQQKTAVAPIVEVRDRNDQPVAGAAVNFAIRSGRASFGGARMLSVTTDVVGRAVASGLTPTGSGAVQITASAAFQGQTAAVTIAQTNVLTAAQAAAIGSSSGAGTASAGGASSAAGAGSAGGGGGVSGLTMGVIAGGVGAGVLAATQLGGDSRSSSSANQPGGPAASPFAIEWEFQFGANLSVIAQCPLYSGPTGSGVGPFSAGGRGHADGTFSWIFSILSPAGQLDGRFTQTDVTATISCRGGGGPTGNLSGSGTVREYRGTWNWGNQSGALVVTPRP
jgi:hypothetical protein